MRTQYKTGQDSTAWVLFVLRSQTYFVQLTIITLPLDFGTPQVGKSEKGKGSQGAGGKGQKEDRGRGQTHAGGFHVGLRRERRGGAVVCLPLIAFAHVTVSNGGRWVCRVGGYDTMRLALPGGGT